MLISTFRDAHQDFVVATGELPRHKANPTCEMTAVLEIRTVTYGGHNSCGGYRSDAFDLRDTLASFIVAENSVDLFVERSNPSIKIPKEIIKLSYYLTSHHGQLIIKVCQDIGDLSPSTGDAFGESKAPIQ
jgi:hypothetical protein